MLLEHKIYNNERENKNLAFGGRIVSFRQKFSATISISVNEEPHTRKISKASHIHH